MSPLLLLLPLLSGCTTQALSPSWLLDRTRILGVRAEPAEARPGDVVSLASLTYDPDQDLLVVWAGCVLEVSNDYGCLPDESGFLGAEPIFPPTLSVPTDILDDLDAAARENGKNYILTLSALPGDTDLSNPDQLSEDDILEIGYKRLPVSESALPNHNPTITSLMVDGDVPVEPGDTLVVQRGQTYDIEPILSDDSVEAYTYVDSDGVAEDRFEEPYFTNYATDGQMVEPFTLYPYSAFSWTAPVDPVSADLTIIVVARDRRGGMGWFTLPVLMATE